MAEWCITSSTCLRTTPRIVSCWFKMPADRVCTRACGLHAPERVLVLADAAVHHQQLRAPEGGRVDGHRHMADARRGRRIASGACRQQAASSAADT